MAWWKNLEGLGVMFEAVYNFSFDNFPQTAQESYRAVSHWVGVVPLAWFAEDDCSCHLLSGGEEIGEQAVFFKVEDGLAQVRPTGLDGPVWDLVPARGFVW